MNRWFISALLAGLLYFFVPLGHELVAWLTHWREQSRETAALRVRVGAVQTALDVAESQRQALEQEVALIQTKEASHMVRMGALDAELQAEQDKNREYIHAMERAIRAGGESFRVPLDVVRMQQQHAAAINTRARTVEHTRPD